MKILIIGAGVAGLSIGWKLATRGADVTVLERASVARAATWAAVGMIAATAESAGAPPAEAALCRASAKLWPEFADEIEESKLTLVNGGSAVQQSLPFTYEEDEEEDNAPKTTQ